MPKSIVFLTALVLLFLVVLYRAEKIAASAPPAEAKKGYRLAAQNGWTYVHLEGSPHEMGFQNGYLLSSEVADILKVVQLETKHDYQRDWSFFRDAAQNMMWPRIEQEYREELQGIADGASAKGAKLDVWDVVAMNAAMEWSYYVKQYDKEHGSTKTAKLGTPEHCSAFVAVGSYTKDGKVVIAHNNWSSYLEGERWTVIFDMHPANGKRMLMDSLPGFIHSGDDFVVNSAGIAITETTIGHFVGFDTAGIPEFVRARKAAQYSSNIDEFARYMKEGNNGGYANAWLVADQGHNEVARLELGLKNVTLERTKDGYFVGSNFPINEKLIKEEAPDYDKNNLSESSNARHVRWEQLMAENKGKIDLAAAQRFEADHYDTFEKKEDPDERSLDGHIDLSPRGSGDWVPPYGMAGAVQNKAADAAMIAKVSFTAAAGHACGKSFKAAQHLSAHPEYDWQKPLQRDMDAYPWTTFSAK